jgi:hypothetical protein
MQRDHQNDAGDPQQSRHVHLGSHRVVRGGDAGDEVEPHHRERESAQQHGKTGDLGRQIGAQPMNDAAEQELGQAREHGHAGDEREAALFRRDDAH